MTGSKRYTLPITTDMKAALACLSLLLLSACASGPTPYQARPADGEHGYSDQALERDRVRVVFRGNFLTPRETVENYLLYRAAELTLERGYRYFVPSVQDVQRDVQQNTVVTGVGTGFGGYGWYGGPVGGSLIIVDSFPARGAESYRASDVVKLLETAPTDQTIDVFDAQEVIDNLGPTVVRPAQAQADRP